MIFTDEKKHGTTTELRRERYCCQKIQLKGVSSSLPSGDSTAASGQKKKERSRAGEVSLDSLKGGTAWREEISQKK